MVKFTQDLIPALAGTITIHTTDGAVVSCTCGTANDCTRDVYLQARFSTLMYNLETLVATKHINREFADG